MTPDCEICASPSRPFSTENGFEILECGTCGHLFVSVQTYQSWQDDADVGFFEAEDAARNGERYRRTYVGQLERLEELVPERGSLLDIGCGFGFFLDAAAQRGWRPFGADVSEVGVAHAREGLGLADVHRGAFGDGVFGDTSFDAVTLWNVLEHVQDPRSLIDVVASRLASNGAIAIRVPNSTAQRRRIELGRAVPSAVAAKVSGLVDVSVLAGAPPHHLHGFTPKSLTQALSERGFSDIQIRPSIVSDFAATAAQRGAVSALTGLISTLERFGPGGWAVGVSPSMTATARWEGAS